MRGHRKSRTLPADATAVAAGRVADRLEARAKELRDQELAAIKRGEQPPWEERHSVERQAHAARILQEEFMELVR